MIVNDILYLIRLCISICFIDICKKAKKCTSAEVTRALANFLKNRRKIAILSASCDVPEKSSMEPDEMDEIENEAEEPSETIMDMQP